MKNILGYVILTIGVIVALWLTTTNAERLQHQAIIENQVRGELAGLVESNQAGTKYEYLRQAEADFVLCLAINRDSHPSLRLDCVQIRLEAKTRVEHINPR